MSLDKSTYPPFRINSKDYFIQKKLGADGYFASAFLVATDNSLKDSLVIKILHPYILSSAITDHQIEEKSKSIKTIDDFVSEAIILSLLERDNLEEAVKLRGVPATTVDLIEDQEKKAKIRKISIELPAEPYKYFPDFVLDYFDGETDARQKLVSSKDDLRNRWPTLGSGIPYLAMEFVNDPYQNLEGLLNKRDFSLDDKLALCRKYIEVLKKIHLKNIVYQDLKESHIFWDMKSRHLKVIDWNASMSGGTDQQKQEDLYIFGKLIFRLFIGNAYINPDQNQQGSRLKKISIDNLVVASGGTSSVDFGNNAIKLPPALRIIIEKLLWLSLDYRYQNVNELEDDFSSKALDEWLAIKEISFDFISKMGLKADGKRTLGSSALRAHDYSDAQNFFKESEYYATSIYAATLLLETRFRQKGDETAALKIKPIQLMLEQNDYDIVLNSLKLSGNNDLANLAFAVEELQDDLSMAKAKASNGDFSAAQDLYLDALMLDYQCEEARSGWEKLNDLILLLNKIEETNRDGRPEQAETLIKAFKNQFGTVSIIQEIQRLIDHQKYYQRALINLQNDRFANALEAVEQAMQCNETVEAKELYSKIKRAIDLQALINGLITNTNYEHADEDYNAAKSEAAKLLDKENFPESQIIKNLFDQVSSQYSTYEAVKKHLEETVFQRRHVDFEESKNALIKARQKALEFSNPSQRIALELQQHIAQETKEVENTQKIYEFVLNQLDLGDYDTALSHSDALKGHIDDSLFQNIRKKAEGAKVLYEKIQSALLDGKYDFAKQTLQEYLLFDSRSSKSKGLVGQVNRETSIFINAQDELNRARGLAGSGQWANAVSILEDVSRMIDQINENPVVSDLKKQVKNDYSANKSALSNFEQVDKYLNEGDISGAITAIDTVLKSFPYAENALRLKQDVIEEQQSIANVQAILGKLKLALMNGNLEDSWALVSNLELHPTLPYVKKLYIEMQIDDWRQRLEQTKKWLDKAEALRNDGEYDEMMLLVDQVLQSWGDCSSAIDFKKELVKQKDFRDKFNNMSSEIEKAWRDGSYPRAIRLAKVFLKENPKDVNTQGKLDGLVREEKIVKDIVSRLDGLQSRDISRADDLLLTDIQNLREIIAPLRTKLFDGESYLTKLVDQIDELNVRLIRSLEEQASKKWVKNNFSESLAIYEKIIKYNPDWLETTAPINKNRVENLRKLENELFSLKAAIESFDYERADYILRALHSDEDYRIGEYGRLLSLFMRWSKELDLGNFEDVIKIYNEGIAQSRSYVNLKNAGLVEQACQVIVKGDIKELSYVEVQLNELMPHLEDDDLFLIHHLNVVLLELRTLLSLTRQIEQLAEQEKYLEAEKSLSGSNHKSQRLRELARIIDDRKVEISENYKKKSQQALENGDYDLALNHAESALKYANVKLQGDLRILQQNIADSKIRDMRDKRGKADDLIHEARNKYEKFMQGSWETFSHHTKSHKQMPKLENYEETFQGIETEIAHCLQLDPENVDARKLQDEIHASRNIFSVLGEIDIAIVAEDYKTALGLARSIETVKRINFFNKLKSRFTKQSAIVTTTNGISVVRYVTIVIDEQQKLNKEFDKIFGDICKDWKYLRCQNILEKGKQSLSWFPSASEQHRTIESVIEIAKIAQQLIQESDRALAERQLVLAQSKYQSLMKHIEASARTFNNNFRSNSGYRTIQAKAKNIANDITNYEKLVRDVSNDLQNHKYKSAHNRFVYLSDHYSSSEEIDRLQYELIQKANELIIQAESQERINNAKSLRAYEHAFTLIEEIDTGRMQELANKRDKVRLAVKTELWRRFRIIGLVTIVILAGIEALVHFEPQLIQLQYILSTPSPSATSTSNPSPTNVGTPTVLDTPTTIATNVTLPSQGQFGVMALLMQGTTYYTSSDRKNIGKTLLGNETVGLCAFDSTNVTYLFAFESSSCNNAQFWANKSDAQIVAVNAPLNGSTTSNGIPVYSKSDSKSEQFSFVIRMKGTEYLVCKAENNRFAIAERDCNQTVGWVDIAYMNLVLPQRTNLQVTPAPIFTVEPTSTMLISTP